VVWSVAFSADGQLLVSSGPDGAVGMWEASTGRRLATLFVVITNRFYAALAASVPGLDAYDSGTRAQISALNPPPDGSSTDLVMAVLSASPDAFHTAMLLAAALLVVGGVVSAVGITNDPSGPSS
jgi:WD40 repeat protein